MMRRIGTLAFAVALLGLVPMADAHGAPDPPEEFTRLLADWDDDCGGDGGAATGACKGSQDLIALDVQEARNADLGDILVFRLYADRGRTYPSTNTLSLTANGATKTFSIATSDGSTYSNSGFDRIGTPKSMQDGTRFTIDLTIKDSTLGVGKGGRITSFKLEAKAGSSVGDFMPGGCHNTVGDCVDTGQSSDQYIAGGGSGSYMLRGAEYYIAISGPGTTQRIPLGTDAFVPLTLTNKFRSKAQTVTLTAQGADGVEAGFHAGSGEPADLQHATEVALPAGGSTQVHLYLRGVRESSGTLRVQAATDLGGTATVDVAYEVMPTASTSNPPAPTTTKGSASPGAVAAILLALALVGRRR